MLTRETYTKAIETGDPSVVCNAIVRLYREQTYGEQTAGETVEQNKVGFNSCDANILTSFAQQILRNKQMKAQGQPFWPVPLSEKQLAIARKKMIKYVGQLIALAGDQPTERRQTRRHDLCDVPTPEPAPLPTTNEGWSQALGQGTLVIEGNNWRFKTPKEMADESGTRWGIDFQPSETQSVDLGELDEFELAIDGLA